MAHKLDLHIRGTQVAVRDTGFSQSDQHDVLPPFIWGHCLLGSMNQDDDALLLQWDELVKRVRVVRYDARGHGISRKCRDKHAFQFPELKKDLLGVADGLGLDRFALGGVSLGSALALHVAVNAPERVSALVLVAPPTAWEMRRRQASLYRNVAMGLRMGGIVPLKVLSAVSKFRNLPLDGAPASVLARSTVRAARHLDRRSAAAAFLGAAKSDLPSPEQLRKIKQPTLILSWHGDTSHPTATADRLLKLLPNSEVHYAKEMEEVRDWTPRVQAFLAKHR